MKIRTHNVRRRGISTVEFALILPILMAMILGTIEMGTMFYSWLTIQKAAQSGARFAATGIGEEEGTRLTQITEVTQEWLKALDNGNTKEITVSFWPTPAATGEGTSGNAGGPCQLVEVEVVYGYQPYTPVLSSVLPDVIHLMGTDRKLNEPWRPCEDY